jgi:hypothetical protein
MDYRQRVRDAAAGASPAVYNPKGLEAIEITTAKPKKFRYRPSPELRSSLLEAVFRLVLPSFADYHSKLHFVRFRFLTSQAGNLTPTSQRIRRRQKTTSKPGRTIERHRRAGSPTKRSRYELR